MLYAIVENGGKQYRAEEGRHIEIDLLPVEIGKKKTFGNVLLLVNGEDVKVGAPHLQGVSVDTTVVNHFKAPKIIVFKYRAKQRYRVKTGHRQQYTRVLVNSIAFPGKSEAFVKKKTETVVKTEKPVAKKKAPTKTETKKPKDTQPAVKEKSKKGLKQVPKQALKEAPSTRKSVKSLELGARTTKALTDVGINTVGQLLKKIESGEENMLEISGIGEKSLVEIKKNLKKLGYK